MNCICYYGRSDHLYNHCLNCSYHFCILLGHKLYLYHTPCLQSIPNRGYFCRSSPPYSPKFCDNLQANKICSSKVDQNHKTYHLCKLHKYCWNRLSLQHNLSSEDILCKTWPVHHKLGRKGSPYRYDSQQNIFQTHRSFQRRNPCRWSMRYIGYLYRSVHSCNHHLFDNRQQCICPVDRDSFVHIRHLQRKEHNAYSDRLGPLCILLHLGIRPSICLAYKSSCLHTPYPQRKAHSAYSDRLGPLCIPLHLGNHLNICLAHRSSCLHTPHLYYKVHIGYGDRSPLNRIRLHQHSPHDKLHLYRSSPCHRPYCLCKRHSALSRRSFHLHRYSCLSKHLDKTPYCRSFRFHILCPASTENTSIFYRSFPQDRLYLLSIR